MNTRPALARLLNRTDGLTAANSDLALAASSGRAHVHRLICTLLTTEHRPTHHLLGVAVDDGGQVDETSPGVVVDDVKDELDALFFA